MAKTSKQLDDEIAEALRDEENRRLAKDIAKMSQHEQELVLRVQEIAALADELKAAGLRFEHPTRKIVVSGPPTYKLRDVLKRYGFRFDGTTKRWSRSTNYAKDDLDYLTFYNDLVRRL